MIWYGEKRCKNVFLLLLIFANIITLYQIFHFLLKKSNHQTPLYHKGRQTLTLKVKGKKKGFLSKGSLVKIKIQDFLES